MKPKFTFFIAFAIYLSALCTLGGCEKTYDSKYDSVDVDEILKSERLLTNYIKCLMDEGPCTEDGQDLKDTLPDAVDSDCSKCTQKQKESSNKIMHFMWVMKNNCLVASINFHFIFDTDRIDNRPDDWTRLEAKFDESGKYRMAYLDSKANNGEHWSKLRRHEVTK